MIAFRVSTETVVADLSEYGKRIRPAAARSLNRAIGAARTVMVREIARDMGMKSGDVRDKLPIREANQNVLSATISASLKRIPLIDFKARGTKRGVTYTLQGGKNRNEHAFIATMKSGHAGVFERVGRKRLPIRELFGPSLGHVFIKYRPLGVLRAQESFQTTFDHEMSRTDSGASAGGD